MNSIRRYFPNCIDVDESDRITVQFDTKEELLGIPFVKRWAENPDFFQYAVSIDTLDIFLMAQFKDGYEWWVIGVLEKLVQGLADHIIPKDYYSDWPRSNFKGKLSDFKG